MKTLSHTYTCFLSWGCPQWYLFYWSAGDHSLYKGRNGTGRLWLSFSQYSTTPGNSLSLGDLSPPGSTTGDSPVLERTLVSCHSFDAELVPLHLHRAVRVVSQGKLRLVSQPKLWVVCFTAQTVRVVSQPKQSGFSAHMWVISQPKLWGWFHSPNWPCTVLTLGDIQIQEVTNLPCIVIVWKLLSKKMND